jgi:signal transduction histidine kinase
MDDSAAAGKTHEDYEAELRAANEIVYKHSLELARLKQALEVANAQQENLLHFISHEIKGYLTKGEAAFAAIAEDGMEVPAPVKELAGSALQEMRKGVATVMDILDAANLKKGTVSFDKHPFDFRAAVENIVREFQQNATEKHVSLTFTADTGDYTLVGDEDKIRRHVIRNVIDNSIRYTPEGSIAVTLSREGNVVRMFVQDTGVGITPEDMQHLFTEGGHGKDSIKVNVHSTGYGLYIAKQIVEAHGGKIWAESKGPGKGSRFIVEIGSS